MKFDNPLNTLSKFEWQLWLISLAVVTISFFLGSTENMLSLVASLVGVTALIFVSKGNVWGQLLTVVFSLLYSVISWQFQYYGEMITYLGMTAPIAVMSVITWLRHPCEDGKQEVKVAHLSRREIIIMLVLTMFVTVVFHFLLAYFHTANLIISTVSIATSFLASYLMLFRSSIYALAYAANDIVLIILWVLATLVNISYLPMIICFVMFLCNDIYGFINWRRMHRKQQRKGILILDENSV